VQPRQKHGIQNTNNRHTGKRKNLKNLRKHKNTKKDEYMKNKTDFEVSGGVFGQI